MNDLSTDGLDAHLSGHGRILEDSDVVVLGVTTDLASFGGKVDDGVLKVNTRSIRQNIESKKPEPDIER